MVAAAGVLLLVASVSMFSMIGAWPADFLPSASSYDPLPAQSPLPGPPAADGPYYQPLPLSRPKPVNEQSFLPVSYQASPPRASHLQPHQPSYQQPREAVAHSVRPDQHHSSPLRFSQGKSSHKPYQTEAPEYASVERPYNYDYTVTDEYSGANFAKHEDSDGKQTVGSYSVSLPDGRIQHVKYVADEYNGFNAVVTYEGEAHYPQEVKSAAKPQPNGHYNPAGIVQGVGPSPQPLLASRNVIQRPHVIPEQAVRQYGPPKRTFGKNFNSEEYGPPRGGGYHTKPNNFYSPPAVLKTESRKLNKQHPPLYRQPDFQSPPVY